MPRRSRLYRAPRDWVVDGQWPHGPFAADAPDVVAHAAEVATALQQALTGRNKTQVAREADVERTTLYDILNGRSWIDTVTLAKLELYLDLPLWPAHPIQPPPRRPI